MPAPAVPTKSKIDGPVLVISVAGKPLLKEAIEKACDEYNAQTLQPLTITEFCAHLIEMALKTFQSTRPRGAKH